MHVCFVITQKCNNSINGAPLNTINGTTCDACPLLQFCFWKKSCCTNEDSTFPEASNKDVGHFSGMIKNVGHGMTFKTLNVSASKVIN